MSQPDPSDPTQEYLALCVPRPHHHVDPCWLAGWMAGHAAGYAAAREDSATRMSLREAQAHIAELRVQMADMQAQMTWVRPEGGADDV